MNFAVVLGLGFILMLAAVIGMSVGVLFGRKPISGSCGGLANRSNGQNCSICSHRDTCSQTAEHQGQHPSEMTSSEQMSSCDSNSP